MRSFVKRAEPRELRYRERADEIYFMPEGQFENRHEAMAIEKDILRHEIKNGGGALTILPEVFKTQKRWSSFKDRYSQKQISFFEVRDDLLSQEQILRCFQEMPEEQFVYSFRKTVPENSFWNSTEFNEILNRSIKLDWPLELGSLDEITNKIPKEKLILSLHDKNRFQEWAQYESKASHMKWAPEISSFSELQQGYEWQRSSSQNRSFLPRSQDGRWQWYRLLQKGLQWINFWKEGEGSAEDQPSLWAWLMSFSESTQFAAVLGDPVAHSFTP